MFIKARSSRFSSGVFFMKAKELAKKLGVSPATVSLVLNNKPGISESLRKSLIQRIEEMGCGGMLCESCKEGNAPSSGKESAACPVIAYLIYTTGCDEDVGTGFPRSAIPFYTAVMEGAEMEARDNRYCLSVLHMIQEETNSLPALLRRAGNVAGVIVQASRIDERVMADMASIDVPRVFVDCYRPDFPYSSVCVNNEQGIFSLTRHLKEKGHRELGYVMSDDTSESLQERLRCFHSALRALDLPDRSENYFTAAWSNETQSFDFHRLSQQFKQRGELPTAIVAEDDGEALHVMLALRDMGLKVPEDVSVVGFDDNFLSGMTEPRLTTVKNYRHLMGRECVVLLQNLIRLRKAGVKNPRLKIEIATKLVERESVKDLSGGQD